MVEEIPIEEILAIKKPDELEIEPPYKAKVLAVEVSEREYQGRKRVQIELVVKRLATQAEDGTWRETPSKPFRIYIPYSKRKASKYGAFLEALWKVAPEVMQNARSLKDLEGAIFVFKTEERKLGNIVANVTVPIEFVGVEPVTEEEKAMVEAQRASQEAEEIADEFAKEVLG